MSLLTAPIVKNIIILARIYFQFTYLLTISSLAIPNLNLSEKIRKVVIK